MDYKEITLLINRFLDGDTSPAEESEIYAFFKNTPDAGDLERFRPMFDWYDSLPAAAPAKKNPKRRMWMAVAGIAAMFAVAVGVVFTFMPFAPSSDRDEMYAMYKGSYVQRNGKRDTDLNRIYSEIVKAEALADSLGSLAEPDYDSVIEATVIDNALKGVADPDLADQIKRDILGKS